MNRDFEKEEQELLTIIASFAAVEPEGCLIGFIKKYGELKYAEGYSYGFDAGFEEGYDPYN